MALVVGGRMTTHTFLAFIYQQRKPHGIIQLYIGTRKSDNKFSIYRGMEILANSTYFRHSFCADSSDIIT